MKRSLKKIAPIVILIILPIVLFYKAVFGTAIITSGDFSGSDLLDLNYPFKTILEKAISQGHLPLWEPNLSLGFPVLAEGQIGAFTRSTFCSPSYRLTSLSTTASSRVSCWPGFGCSSTPDRCSKPTFQPSLRQSPLC